MRGVMAFRQQAIKALCQVLLQQCLVLMYMGILSGLSLPGLLSGAVAQLLKQVRSCASGAVNRGGNTKTNQMPMRTLPGVESGVRAVGANDRSPQLNARPAEEQP